jgi:hypothetical protein
VLVGKNIDRFPRTDRDGRIYERCHLCHVIASRESYRRKHGLLTGRKTLQQLLRERKDAW